MQVNFRAYPHPVLSYFSDDYVRCLYQTNVVPTISRNAYSFSVTAKTSSRGLKELLLNGKALHPLHIECPATRFRKIFTSALDTFNAEIAGDHLDGKVYLCSFIVAGKNIDNYANEEFHSDFEGRSFSIKKGDVLAVDKDRSFIADKDYDPLRKLPSIFTIRKNLNESPPPIDIDSSTNKVFIHLSDELHTLYKKLAADKAMAQILSSMIIVPALVSLLETINASLVANDLSEIEDKRWYRVLTKKLLEEGYSVTEGEFSDSTLVIAQKLIGNPLSLALRSLTSQFVETEEEE